MKKKVSVLLSLMFLLVTIVLADDAYSKNWKDRSIRITIENRYHHLGDNDVDFFLIPEPEGTYWEKSFKIRNFFLKNKENAFVKFLAHEIRDTDLIINGNPIRLNESNEETTQNFSVYVVPIPIDFLLEGKNLIAFESNDGDDMEFGEVQIWLQ